MQLVHESSSDVDNFPALSQVTWLLPVEFVSLPERWPVCTAKIVNQLKRSVISALISPGVNHPAAKVTIRERK